jgi:hypothetical protein
MAAKSSKASPRKSKPKAKSAPKRSKSSSTAAAPPRRAAASAVARPAAKAGALPRSVQRIDDNDVLMAQGGGGGGYGRCGGRRLSNRLEQTLCNQLGLAGVVHSHSPRHYEVRLEDGKVAAYAPQIVLRGRGREGKGVVIEAIEDAQAPILRKISAFRTQYGQEFYIILVASDDVLDQVSVTAYDESCSSINVNTLISRLAE